MLVIAGTASSQMATVLSDEAGDVEVRPSTTLDGVVVGEWRSADIVELSIEETPTDFIFRIHVDELATGPDTSNALFRGTFDAAGREFGFYVFQEEESAVPFGMLYRENETGALLWDRNLIVDLDPSTDALVFEIPRGALDGADGNMLLAGDEISGFTIRSQALYRLIRDTTSFQSTGPVVDQAPDDLTPTGSYDVSFGYEELHDDIALTSFPEFHGSNGEARTFFYAAMVNNTSSRPQDIALSLEDVPQLWEATMNPGNLTLEPGAHAVVNITLRPTGFHAHGGADIVRLAAENSEGSRTGIGIGLIYYKAPQPAGHHPLLYFDTQTAGELTDAGRVTMSTVEPDAEKQGPARGKILQRTPESRTVEWTSCLLPNIQQPILFADRPGEVNVRFASELPIEGAQLSGELVLADTSGDPQCRNVYLRDENTRVLGTVEPQTIDLPAGEVREFSLSFTANTTGSMHVPEGGENLVLRLFISTEGLGAWTAWDRAPRIDMNPGGFIHLPLEDIDSNPLDAFGHKIAEPMQPAEESPSNESPPMLMGGLLAVLIAAFIRRSGQDSK